MEPEPGELWIGRKRETGGVWLRLPTKRGFMLFKELSFYQAYEVALELEMLGYPRQADEIRAVLERMERVPAGQPIPGMHTLEDGEWEAF